MKAILDESFLLEFCAKLKSAGKNGMNSNKTTHEAVTDTEKLEVMAGLYFLRKEAAQGKREDFERYLEAIPDIPLLVDDI